MHRLENIIDKFARKSIEKKRFFQVVNSIEIFQNLDEAIQIEMLESYGLPLKIKGNRVYLKTRDRRIEDEVFCIVDIETNGSKPEIHQIIEIAAIKIKNGKIIDKFESFVYSDILSEQIQKLTNISLKDLKKAPKIKFVLEKFKTFLGDAVFIAHSVKFDYNFISASLKKANFGELLNRKLCTIDLAKRTIKAQKYGLKYLQEHLNLDFKVHHRAYADTKNTGQIFLISLEKLPNNIKTTEELIEFSKMGEIILKKENISKKN